MTVSAAVLWALAGANTAVPAQPPMLRYTVKRGDTLIGLARRGFVRVDSWVAVQRLNRISSPSRLSVGKTLSIPRRLLKTEPVGARVAAFRGNATLSGKVPVLGAPIGEGMTIVTGDNASITIECTDGSRFSLPSQTRIGVVRLRRLLLTGDLDRVFATSQGRGEWSVSPAPTQGSRFMVTTPVSVSAVRGTGFRVGYEGTASVGVVEGTVGVSGNDRLLTTAVHRGEAVAVTATGVSPTIALLPAPELQRPGAVQSGPLVRFKVDQVAGARTYVFEVGSDAALIDRIGEFRGSDGDVTFGDIADGSYFVRATATDSNGIDGFAKIWAFERLMLSTRPPESVGRGFRFRWQGGNDGPRDYRFTLYADEAATRPLIDRSGIQDSSFIVTDLKPGTYWWRVVLTRFKRGQAIVATGDLQSFTIAPRTR